MRWRRLDLPGTDEAELESTAAGFQLRGRARFAAREGAVDLTYAVAIGPDWQTRSAVVRGSMGAGPVAFEIAASSERRWTIDGRPAPAVTGCIDVDLNFTPATNLLSIRRLALGVGARSEVTAAWLVFPGHELQPLRQVYTRTTNHQYAYSCPELPFDSTLDVNDAGFVRNYPPLWEEQA